MAFVNELNESAANVQQQRAANQRLDHLLALGADRGVARQIVAMEFGFVGGDRVELDAQDHERDDLSLFAADGPASNLWPHSGALIPDTEEGKPGILTPGSPIRGRNATGTGTLRPDPLF